MIRKFRVLPLATRDMLATRQWLGERSPEGSDAWRQAADACVRRVATNPESYGAAPESALFNLNLREAFFHTRQGRRYRLIFLLESDEVVVLRIRGPGQQLLNESDLGV